MSTIATSGFDRVDRAQQVLGVVGLRSDLDPGLLEHGGDPPAHEEVIVRDHNAKSSDLHSLSSDPRTSAGSSARSFVP